MEVAATAMAVVATTAMAAMGWAAGEADRNGTRGRSARGTAGLHQQDFPRVRWRRVEPPGVRVRLRVKVVMSGEWCVVSSEGEYSEGEW